MKDLSIVVHDDLSEDEKKSMFDKIHKALSATFLDVDDLNLDLISYNDPKHINFDLKGDFDVVKKSEDGKRIIAGYASVAVIDDDNQFIPPEVLEEGLKSLLDDESYANVMVVHKNIQIGKILKEYSDLKTQVDDKGLYIVAEIRNDLESAQGIWRKIVSGVMKGFSIGGEIIDKHNHCDDDKCYEIIDKINLFEVSVCSNPINKSSGFEIIAKSDVCEKLDNNECDKMTEEEKQDEEICEDCKEKAEKSEEQVDKNVEEEPTEEAEKAEDSNEESTEDASETEETDNLSEIIDRMNEMFATMEKSITENFQEIMKSMKEDDPVEEETEEKSEDSEESEEVEKTEKSEDDEKEIQYALKARDDAIKGYEEKVKELKARIKELEETEEEPQTTSGIEESLEKDTGIIIKHGKIYRK